MAANPFKQLDVIRNLSENEKRIKDCYRLMYKKELWVKAYIKLYPKPGNLTKGVNDDTIDGFSMAKINKIIEELKSSKFRFKPVRRTYIPKRNGKKRPLGIASFKDKLVQEVIRMILENIYEPVFSNTSHGFRPDRSCHTALSEIKHTWTGMIWCIEGDIKDFFNNINHKKLIEILSRKIDDKRFLLLIDNALKCGYVEEWKFNKTYSGCPQGGIISPILSNIYLNEFDKFMEKNISKYNKGNKRKYNPDYYEIRNKRYALKYKVNKYDNLYGDKWEGRNDYINKISSCLTEMQKLPSMDIMDRNYRRMRYVRYADDWVCGVIGTKKEAHYFKNIIKHFLKDELYLDLSEEKTLITNIKERVNFLGYAFKQWRGIKISRVNSGTSKYLVKKRTLTKQIRLEVPKNKIQRFAGKNAYGDYDNMKSLHRCYLINNTKLEIMSIYNQELRGFANYYKLADNYCYLGKLFYIAESSFIKTLTAKKKNSTFKKILFSMKKFEQGELVLAYKNSAGQTVNRRFLKLKHIPRVKEPIRVSYNDVDNLPNILKYSAYSELEQRIAANKCEACGCTDGFMEVHHIKKLKDIKNKKNLTFAEKLMIARNRKTIILCRECHNKHHSQNIPINQLASRIH